MIVTIELTKTLDRHITREITDHELTEALVNFINHQSKTIEGTRTETTTTNIYNTVNAVTLGRDGKPFQAKAPERERVRLMNALEVKLLGYLEIVFRIVRENVIQANWFSNEDDYINTYQIYSNFVYSLCIVIERRSVNREVRNRTLTHILNFTGTDLVIVDARLRMQAESRKVVEDQAVNTDSLSSLAVGALMTDYYIDQIHQLNRGINREIELLEQEKKCSTRINGIVTESLMKLERRDVLPDTIEYEYEQYIEARHNMVSHWVCPTDVHDDVIGNSNNNIFINNSAFEDSYDNLSVLITEYVGTLYIGGNIPEYSIDSIIKDFGEHGVKESLNKLKEKATC